MRTIITTVGTSVLTNAQRHLGQQSLSLDDLTRYLRSVEATAGSAETNSVTRLVAANDRTVLVHSQTPEGALCAAALERYFAARDVEASVVEVRDLVYSESRFKLRGLRSLVATLVELVDKERRAGREVLINATGGFKAEAAYATLVGLLLRVPVYYIHERFNEIVEMPTTPLSWDLGLIAEHESFFDWIDGELRSAADVERRAVRDGVPDSVRLLLVEEGGLTLLSAAGEACYRAYRVAIEQAAVVPLLLSSKAKKQLEAMDATAVEAFRRLFARLRCAELRAAGSECIAGCDGAIYPQGHRPERVFYAKRVDGALLILELSLHGSDYGRRIARGVRVKDYEGFEQW